MTKRNYDCDIQKNEIAASELFDGMQIATENLLTLTDDAKPSEE